MKEVLTDLQPELKTENLLGQIDKEVEQTTAATARSGWTPQVVLVTLVPLGFYVISLLQTRMTEPTTTLDRWVLLTLLINLVYDAVCTYPHMAHTQFFPSDVRLRFQWSGFLGYRFNFVDTVRYVMMASAAWHLWGTAEDAVIALVMVFYAALVVRELLKGFAAATRIPVPLQSLRYYGYRVAFVLYMLGCLGSWLYAKAAIDRLGEFEKDDLLVVGATAGIFYLARLIFDSGSSSYLTALRGIRCDLALGDINVTVAKQRFRMVRDGWTLVESLDEITVPFRLVLGKLREEMQAATDLLTAQSQPAIARLAESAEHDLNYREWVRQFDSLCADKRLRTYNRYMRFYLRRLMPILTLQSRHGIERVFAELRAEHAECISIEERYLTSRQQVLREAGTAADGIVVQSDARITELPAVLDKARETVLRGSNREALYR